MSRTPKTGLDYFPFDADFFVDHKIRILKARFGATGICLYLFLLCEIYRDKGYYLRFDSDCRYTVSDDLNLDAGQLRAMLQFLLERGLFDKKRFQEDEILTSVSIQKRYQEAVKTRGAKNPVAVDEAYWLLPPEETRAYIVFPGKYMDSSSENRFISSELSPKESKGKEIKEKERIKNAKSVEELEQAILERRMRGG